MSAPERHNKTWEEMVGDGAREIGELVLVFGLLDGALSERPLPDLFFPIILAGGIVFWVGGLLLEMTRPEDG